MATHFFVDDIITNYAIIDRLAYTLIGTPDQVEHNPLMYAGWVCGMIYVDKINPQNRKDAVEKMVRVLENNTSVIIYPEGAWNNTENLLVQPLFASPWILAQRTGCKVVPIACTRSIRKRIFGIVPVSLWIWQVWKRKKPWTNCGMSWQR